jgi:RNA polymerase sigma-70 factor (ECF subfamily)
MKDDALEAGLIERARSGDQDAFGRLMEAHLERVWGLVWRVLRHREDTEDVVQEVFLSVALPPDSGDASLATWLGRIASPGRSTISTAAARRCAAARCRCRSSRTAPGRPGRPADGRASRRSARVLEARDLGRRLSDCLARLPAAWRAALALRHGDHRTYEEIAASLGVALGTVRSRLARARLALKECVESVS